MNMPNNCNHCPFNDNCNGYIGGEGCAFAYPKAEKKEVFSNIVKFLKKKGV